MSESMNFEASYRQLLRDRGYGLLDAKRLAKKAAFAHKLRNLRHVISNSLFVRRKHVLELIDIIAEMQNVETK